jgi:hypothetical protein
MEFYIALKYGQNESINLMSTSLDDARNIAVMVSNNIPSTAAAVIEYQKEMKTWKAIYRNGALVIDQVKF